MTRLGIEFSLLTLVARPQCEVVKSSAPSDSSTYIQILHVQLTKAISVVSDRRSSHKVTNPFIVILRYRISALLTTQNARSLN